MAKEIRIEGFSFPGTCKKYKFSNIHKTVYVCMLHFLMNLVTFKINFLCVSQCNVENRLGKGNHHTLNWANDAACASRA